MTDAAKFRTLSANSMASEIAHDLFELADSLEVGRAAQLAAANLEPTAFDDPGARISYPQAILLWTHLGRERPDLPLGILLGQRSISGFGALGLAVQHASNGTEGLELLKTFLSSITTGGRLVSDQDGDTVRVSIQHLPEVESLAHPIDYGMIMLCRLLVGDDFRGKIVAGECKHRPFGPASGYESVFGTAFTFGGTSNTLWFNRALLEEQRPNTNPRMVHYLRAYLVEQVARLPGPPLPFQLQLEQTVKELAQERCFQTNAVAVRMGLSQRSLQRRAAAEGLQVSGIIEAARQEQATRELTFSTDSIPAIAEQLGYSDERSFSRAFQRWTGFTPSMWRRKKTIQHEPL